MASDGDLVLRAHLPLPLGYAAPRTGTEEKLAEIWRLALNMDCVGVEDHYNDLGGDSFIAALMFSLIDEAFAIDIPAATLLSAPTIAQLARQIDVRLARKSARPCGRPDRSGPERPR
jgi:acyl carrier protein